MVFILLNDTGSKFQQIHIKYSCGSICCWTLVWAGSRMPSADKQSNAVIIKIEQMQQIQTFCWFRFCSSSVMSWCRWLSWACKSSVSIPAAYRQWANYIETKTKRPKQTEALATLKTCETKCCEMLLQVLACSTLAACSNSSTGWHAISQ